MRGRDGGKYEELRKDMADDDILRALNTQLSVSCFPSSSVWGRSDLYKLLCPLPAVRFITSSPTLIGAIFLTEAIVPRI